MASAHWTANTWEQPDMNFRAPPKEHFEIVVTPLIDVVLVLLIFYMVSTTFVSESQMELTLPQASAEVPADPPDKIDIAIDRQGNVFIDEQALLNTQIGTIRRALAAARSNGEPVVIISADAGADYQSVVDVMDAARQVGLYRITFPTRVREDQ